MKPNIINTRPHFLRFQTASGEVYIVPSSREIISAVTVEVFVKKGNNGIGLVRPEYRPTPEGWKTLKKLKEKHPNAIIVGSILTAQAYPGEIYAPVPLKGFEKVANDQKRARDDIFTTFEA